MKDLEMISSSLPPSPVMKGQLWLDTSTDTNVLRAWDGEDWMATGFEANSNSLPPSPPIKGQAWVDPKTDLYMIWNGEAWVPPCLGANSNGLPPNPFIKGQLWFNTATDVVMSWDGEAWIPAGLEMVSMPSCDHTRTTFASTSHGDQDVEICASCSLWRWTEGRWPPVDELMCRHTNTYSIEQKHNFRATPVEFCANCGKNLSFSQ